MLSADTQRCTPPQQVLAVRGADSGGGSLPDPFVALFPGAVPGDLCAIFDVNDDSGCGLDAYLAFTDRAAGTYTAVVIDISEQPGTYTFEGNTFSGPEVCLAALPVPYRRGAGQRAGLDGRARRWCPQDQCPGTQGIHAPLMGAQPRRTT